MSGTSARLLWLAGVFVIGAGAPVAIEEARAHLASMSESQRQRVQTNWELFQTLPLTEKEELRRLHTELEGVGAEAAELQSILTQYTLWLDTLAPADRKAIADAATTEERLQKVSNLIDAQNERLGRDLKPFFGPPDEGPRKDIPSRLRKAFTTQTRESFAELESALLPKLTTDEKIRLTTLGDRPSLHRGALLLALKSKYDISLKTPIPGKIEEMLIDRYAETMQRLFGMKAKEAATEAEQTSMLEFLLDILLFPDVEPKKLVSFLETVSPEETDQLRMTERIHSELYPLVVRMIYYRENPEELPLSLRDTFRNVPRSVWGTSPPIFPLDRRFDRGRWDDRRRSGSNGDKAEKPK